jgi:beta-phosphoglucomutase-like phosphatase (HAD superfamily)
VLGLPNPVAACLFDLDGVLTQTARLHAAAWQEIFGTYLAAARCLGAGPATAAVFEAALAGVAAGRAGGFGWVAGVDRVGQWEALRREGADIVITDLADLLPGS